MTCTEILPRLYEIIRTLIDNPPELTPDTDLLNDIGLDSLAVMHLLEQVEDDFDVLVPLNVIAEVRTLNDFALQLQKIIDGGN
jgi:acyl carrier protein